LGQLRSAERIDAVGNEVEPATGQAMLDRPRAEAEIEELLPRNSSVLLSRQSPNTITQTLRTSRSFD
jgi:hypothetical protein